MYFQLVVPLHFIPVPQKPMLFEQRQLFYQRNLPQFYHKRHIKKMQYQREKKQQTHNKKTTTNKNTNPKPYQAARRPLSALRNSKSIVCFLTDFSTIKNLSLTGMLINSRCTTSSGFHYCLVTDSCMLSRPSLCSKAPNSCVCNLFFTHYNGQSL